MTFSDRNAAYDLSLFEEEEEQLQPKSEAQKSIVYDINRERRKRRLPNVDPLAAFIALSATVLCVIALVAIIHGQAQLTELNQQISDAQIQLTELQSYYTQMEMKVENKLGPSVIEEYAKNELGMKKTQSFQKEFISLSEGDSATIANGGKKNFIESVLEHLDNLWGKK
ncbi:MAG: septum formation initiator family protein [Acutalibacteraceae bacterium]|nr:septum formation initiator family protein [Clostridia bacterium]MEE3449319.1 septum formation initiator family protein [Acutalibacteraceae bacterium]